MNAGLENLERNKLEYLLDTESFINNTFDKDTLVDMWIKKVEYKSCEYKNMHIINVGKI